MDAAAPPADKRAFFRTALQLAAWHRFVAALESLPEITALRRFVFAEIFGQEGGMAVGAAGEVNLGSGGARSIGAQNAIGGVTRMTLAEAIAAGAAPEDATRDSVTPEQIARIYEFWFARNLAPIGGAQALEEIADPFAAAAFADTLFWQGATSGARTLQAAIGGAVTQDGVLGPLTRDAYIRLARDSDTRGILLDTLAAHREDWAIAAGQHDAARIAHFRYTAERAATAPAPIA